jgi:thiosulfate dehydrogenase (quinone) large subunit
MLFQPESDWRSDASLAYALMRLSFGVNLFMRGVMRIYMGTGGFAQGMLKQFENTPMPAGIVQPFALTLPWVESAIGLMLILGLKTRVVLVAGSLMMTALTFGTMVRQDFQTAWLQLGYVLIFFILLALRSWNLISIDAALQRPKRAEGRTRTTI